METQSSFDTRFLALWDDEPALRQEWSKLETLYGVTKEISRNLAVRALAYRNIVELQAEIESCANKDNLVLECLSVSWSRLLLRSCLKVRDSLELIFCSINSANAYGCALAARGIIEHVGLMQYFWTRVPWQNGRVVSRTALVDFAKEFFNLVGGSKFDWDKVLFGGLRVRDLIASKSWKRPNNDWIPRISKLVEALDKEIAPSQGEKADGYLLFVYSALCDVVHPSWGGDFIYAPSIHRDIKLTACYDAHFKRIATLFCLPIVTVIYHFAKLVKLVFENEPKWIAVPESQNSSNGPRPSTP